LSADPAAVLGLLYRAAGAEALAGQPDADLVRRFAAAAGAAEAAFAALLRRHGPAVWRVCRAYLREPADAEDAFQATFLVLATRAGSLALRGPLGPWLAGVARRVALRARAAAARRRRHECRAARAEAVTDAPAEPDTAAAVLDAVARLPGRLRAPVLLCDLEGLTYQEAAGRLGLSHAAVRNRLARGRRRLRAALRRLGLAPAALAAPLAVPRALAAATARAAVAVATGSANGMVSESVLELMTGGLLMSKLKTVCLSLLAAGVLIAGAVGLSAQAPAPTPAPAVQIQADANGGRRSETEAVHAVSVELVLAGDPAERIARLAREAKQRQEAGDAKGARQALRRLHAAAFDWEDALAEERPSPRLSVRNVPSVEAVPDARPTTPHHVAATPASGSADMESRLRDVERKLDRLLKALERQPDGAPRPTPSPQSR
jgi:RNA polymerase sigma factor (sigma-70 family)